MTNIIVNKEYLQKEINKKLDDPELREKISMMGTDPEEITSDEITVEIFPNRPDLLSGYSIVRSFKQFLGKNKGLIKYKAKKPLKNYKVKIDKSVKKVRPYTACAIVKNLKLNHLKIKEIIQLQEKLHLTYGRERKKLAIGIYPLEKIKLPITYKALKPSKIKFKPLDAQKEMNGNQILRQHPAGVKYASLLKDKELYPVFIDSEDNILSMPPIINSERTGRITEKTKAVFIECSGFDYEALKKCLNIIVTILADMKGTIYKMNLEYEKKKISPNLKPETMNLDLGYVKKVLGIEIKPKKAKECLEKMGYGIEIKNKKLKVSIPCYRADILGPIDLVEDLAIGYGYNNFDPIIPKVATTSKELDINVFERKLRRLLAGFKLLEIKNYEIINKYLQTKAIRRKEKPVELLSSVSSEYDSLRTTLAGSMLDTLRFNLKNEQECSLFEIGTTFHHDSKEETNIREEEKLGIIISKKDANFTDAKQILTTLMKELNLKYTLSKSKDPLFIEGRAGKIKIKNKIIGNIGEMYPQVICNFDLINPCSYIEIDLDKLLKFIK